MNPKQFLETLHNDGLPETFPVYGHQLRKWVEADVGITDDLVYTVKLDESGRGHLATVAYFVDVEAGLVVLVNIQFQIDNSSGASKFNSAASHVGMLYEIAREYLISMTERLIMEIV